MTFTRFVLMSLFASVLYPDLPAEAQPLGTHRWQLQPFCNVIILAITQQGGQYLLDGTDDQCAAAQAASVRGMAFLNPNGTIGVGLTVVTAPGARAVHVDATIVIGTLNGSWTDSAGNGGAFVFTPGPGVPGPPRPVPSGGLAPGSVTPVQLSPSVYAGSGSATTVARSDHSHDDRYYPRAQVDASRTITQLYSPRGMVWPGASTPFTSNRCPGRPTGAYQAGFMPVDVPVGATVLSATAYVFDAPGSNSYSLSFIRSTLAFGADDTILSSANGGDTTASLDTHVLSFGPELVDSGDSFYLVFVTAETENGFCGVRLTYRLPPL